MSIVLRGLITRICLAYFDDLIVLLVALPNTSITTAPFLLVFSALAANSNPQNVNFFATRFSIWAT